MGCDEVTREFLLESHEGLDRLEREFAEFLADPGDRERIASVFRTIHTIKGTSGFLGYTRLQALTHAGESLLSVLRDGSVAPTSGMGDVLQELVERVRGLLRAIEATGGEDATPQQALIDRLDALRTAPTPATPGPEGQPVAAAAVESVESAAPSKVEVEVQPIGGEASSTDEQPSTPPRPPPAPTPAPELPVPRVEQARPTVPSGGWAAPAEAPPPQGPPVTASAVRVDVALLDRLVNAVGELVLVRNRILQLVPKAQAPALLAAAQALNHITTDLQSHVMKTRMQPIASIWSRLPRLVREVAGACGKQVRVELHGKETELDRTILEAIRDPLVHVVRNAIDHGIETPAARFAQGKVRTGSLVLRAFHRGGQVHLEIEDDGAGLNLEAIRRKAAERKLVEPERLARMSASELAQLVFLPGFSTAATVTHVSGRGVGMDVVKTNVERIGGTVELASVAGAGTIVRIRLPLTLAIIPALTVGASGQRYAIPQASLVELLHFEGERAQAAIDTIQGASVCRLRGRLLPLVHLGAIFAGDPRGALPGGAPSAIDVVVVQADEQAFGLAVDEVGDTEEIVVKPLGRELRDLTVFAGSTVMGDGRVALILDVAGLGQQAGIIQRGVGARRGVAVQAAPEGPPPHAASPSATARLNGALLLVSTGAEDTFALPLSAVARLEEFSPDRLERVGGRLVVQHRGSVMPLVDLTGRAGSGATPLRVVVFAEGERKVGLVVERIVDVVEDEVLLDRSAARPGSLGAAVVQGRVLDLVDVPALVRERAPWFAAAQGGRSA